MPESGNEDRLLRHVPDIGLRFDGDCRQANGIDLPIVVINLARRTDRWQTLTRRLSAVGLTRLIRAPAVEGAALPDAEVATLLGTPEGVSAQPPRSHLELTRPAIGCFLSHLAVWRWLIGASLPGVLVLEDDAAPTAHFGAGRLRSVLDALPAAGHVFLGRIIMAGLADAPRGDALARLYYFNGTFAYLITPAAARALLPHLLPLRCHIDHQISRALIDRRQTLAAFSAEPPLFEPDWTLRSDCYVPLADEPAADREFGQYLEATRGLLLAEGRPLVPLSG